MANLQRLSLVFPRTIFRRQFSLAKICNGGGGRAIYADKDTPILPVIPCRLDRPTLGQDMVSLTQKEKAPWKDFTIEEKVALYRAQFKETYVEGNSTDHQWLKLIGGTLVGLALSMVLFMFTLEYISAKPPRTMTAEYKAMEEERMKVYRMEPITGISYQPPAK